MTGQSKNTETSNKRKNRPSQGETGQNSTSSKKKSKSSRPSSESQMEVEELKRKVSELQAKNNELSQKNTLLQYQLDNYEILQLLNDDNDSQAEDVSDDSTPQPKRRKKLSEEEEKAKSLMKTLLRTMPEFELDEKEIFTSTANTNTCTVLVPELQKLMNEHNCNTSSEQVKAWLRSIHGVKRKAYKRLNQSNQQSNTLNQSTQSNPSNQSNSMSVEGDSQEAEKKSKERKSNKLKNEEKIEDSAKTLLKRLLDNTYIQDEYKLKFDGDDGTFSSQVNVEVCKKLIPRLIEDIKPIYYLTHKQVESWLKSVHKLKRTAYFKSIKMEID